MFADDPYDNPHAGQQRAAPARPFDPDATEDERTWALLGHLSILSWSLGVPLVPILVLWAIKRSDGPFVGDHLTESLNFQISLVIYSILIIPITFITCGIGAIFLYPALFLIALIGTIFACLAAHRSEFYRYPMCLRLIPG